MATIRLIDANALERRFTSIAVLQKGPKIRLVKAICEIHDAPTVDAVILPCKIGDTVWTITYGGIREAKVTCIRPFVFENFVEYRGNAAITMADQFYSDGRPLTQGLFIVFGKDAFLTREEAEAALAKMDEGNDDA